ncbi:hypothetical protein PQX77_021073 [Marasmius sp. AFHP31]|nr:hypothetical protein PQX77_021073 [Marasmius sp. AFHP31]
MNHHHLPNVITHESSRVVYPLLVNEQAVATLVVANFVLSFLGVVIGLWLVIEFASGPRKANTEDKGTEAEDTSTTRSQSVQTSPLSSSTRRNTPNSNVAAPDRFASVAVPGHEEVASSMAHRLAPVIPDNTTQANAGEETDGSLVAAPTSTTTPTNSEASSNTQIRAAMEEPSQSWLTISAEPRRNRAVASSWPKVQVEIKAPQDTTSQAGTFISPEAEAGPSMLNRSSPADAVVPAGRERDTDGPSSPVDILALSTDFPTARLSAFEKPKVTSSLSPNTKPAPSPDSANAYADTADIAPSFTNGSLAAGSSGKEVSLTPPVIGEAGSSKKRVETNVDEPPSQSVPVAFPTSTSSEVLGTTATSSNLDLSPSPKTLNPLSQLQLDMGVDLESSNPPKSSSTVALPVSTSATTATSNLGARASAATSDGSHSPLPSSPLLAPPAPESTSIATSPLLPSCTSITNCSDDVETRKKKGKAKERETDSESSSSSAPYFAGPYSSQVPVDSRETKTKASTSSSVSISTPVVDVSATPSTSSSKNLLDARTGAGVSRGSVQDKGKGKETERGTTATTPLPAFFFGLNSRNSLTDPIRLSLNDATGPSSTPKNIFDSGIGAEKVQGSVQTSEDRDKGKQPERAASSSEGNAAASSPRTATSTNSNNANSTPFIPKSTTTADTPPGFSFTGTGITNVTPNPKTTAPSSSSRARKTIPRPKFSFAPSPSVSNPNPFDFASPPPGNHTRATFHPFPQPRTSDTTPGTSAPATASGSEVLESGTEVGEVGSGFGDRLKAGPSVSGSGTTNTIIPPQAAVTSSSPKKPDSGTGRTGTGSSSGLPGERPKGRGMGAGVSMGTMPAPVATSTSTAKTSYGGSSSTPLAPSSSPSVTRTGTGTSTSASTVPRSARTTAPVPVVTLAQLPTRPQPQPADDPSLGRASEGSATAPPTTTTTSNHAPSSSRQPSRTASSNQAETRIATVGNPSPSVNGTPPVLSEPTSTRRRAQTASVGDPAVTAVPPGRRTFMTLRPAITTPRGGDVDQPSSSPVSTSSRTTTQPPSSSTTTNTSTVTIPSKQRKNLPAKCILPGDDGTDNECCICHETLFDGGPFDKFDVDHDVKALEDALGLVWCRKCWKSLHRGCWDGCECRIS